MCVMEVCACVCYGEVCVLVMEMCVRWRGACVMEVCVCVMEVGVEQGGLEECQDHSFYFGEKAQSGARRQGFLCASLLPQRLRKNWPTADSSIYPLGLV